MNKKICHKCKYENGEFANFCKSCGTPLENKNNNQTSKEQAKQIINDSKESVATFFSLLKIIFINPISNLFKTNNKSTHPRDLLFIILAVLNLGIFLFVLWAFIFSFPNEAYIYNFILLMIMGLAFFLAIFNQIFLKLSFILAISTFIPSLYLIFNLVSIHIFYELLILNIVPLINIIFYFFGKK